MNELTLFSHFTVISGHHAVLIGNMALKCKYSLYGLLKRGPHGPINVNNYSYFTSANRRLIDSFCWVLFRLVSSRWRCSCDTSSCHWLRSSTSRYWRSTTERCICIHSRDFFSSYISKTRSNHIHFDTCYVSG